MTNRIWPGALCYIKDSEFAENVGRVVMAESLECESPRIWNIIVSGEPLRVWDSRCDDYLSHDALAPEASLQPLTPPPSAITTDDTAPCEVSPRESEQV